MTILGFFVGIAVIIVAVDVALGLNFLSTYLGIQPVPINSTN